MLLAEAIVDRMPSVEMVRMTSSGTEASMSAIRLARAATGREPVVKFAGAYHGHVDGLLAQAGSGLATQGIPASPGVTAAATAATVIVAWNDRRGACAAPVQRVARGGHHRRADPGQHGRRAAGAGLSRAACARSADATGALLIFDEVISGFRVARGGAQELYGVTPDLTIWARSSAGACPRPPTAAGASSWSRSPRPARSTRPARCREIRSPWPRRWPRWRGWTRAAYVAAGRAHRPAGRRSAPRRPLRPGCRSPCSACPGLLTPFFCAAPVRSYADAAACDLDAYGACCRALLARGVYPPASQFEAWFPSLAHTEADIELTLAAAAQAFAEVAAR